MTWSTHPFYRHPQRSKCPLCVQIHALPPCLLQSLSYKHHRIYPSRLPGAQPRRREHKRSSVPMRKSSMQACNRIAEWRKSNSESKKHPAVGTGCHRYSLDISCVYLTRADHGASAVFTREKRIRAVKTRFLQPVPGN